MKKQTLQNILMSLVMLTGIASAEIKIGVYDMQEVVDTLEDGKKAKQDFQKAYDAKKKDLETKEKEISKMMESLEKQKLVLSAQAFEEKRREMQARGNEFMQQQMSAEMELKKKDLELRGKLFTKVRAVVEKVGKDGNYTVVLEKGESGVVYFPTNIDLTKKVIEEYNKAYKK